MYLENRPTIQDMEKVVDQRISKEDLQVVLNKKVDVNDIKHFFEQSNIGIEFKKD